MKKVSEEELKELQELGSILNEVTSTIGQLHLSKKMIMDELDQIHKEMEQQENRFVDFRKREQVLFERLQKKYGTSDVDIVTGEITQ